MSVPGEIPELIVGQRYKVAPKKLANPNLYSFVGTFAERIDAVPTPSSSSTVHFRFTNCVKEYGAVIPEFVLKSPHLFTFVHQPATGGRRRQSRRTTRNRRRHTRRHR